MDWLSVVAIAYTSGAEAWTQGGVTVRRVLGGTNNALYRVECGEQWYACKLCVADERCRAAREYGALALLHRAGTDIAPQPLLLDESCALLPYPVVIYRWLPGTPLGPSLTAGQLAALLESIQRIHALRRDDWRDAGLPDAWFHWFDYAPYLAELDGFLIKYGGWLVACQAAGQNLRDRLARLVDGCAARSVGPWLRYDRESRQDNTLHIDRIPFREQAKRSWLGHQTAQVRAFFDYLPHNLKLFPLWYQAP